MGYVKKESIIQRIKEMRCVGCDNCRGILCRACEYADIIDIIEDTPEEIDYDLWTSVDECLPNEYGRYLVIMNGEITELTYTPSNYGCFTGWSDDIGANYIKLLNDGEVTHWRSKTLYKEKNKNEIN